MIIPNKLSLIAVLLLCIVAVPFAYAGQKPTAPKGQKVRRVADPITIERRVFASLNLSPGQKRKTDKLLADMQAGVRDVEGKGIVPLPRNVMIKRVQEIKSRYQNGLKSTLTPAQYKKYLDIHKRIQYSLRQIARRRRRGLHY